MFAKGTAYQGHETWWNALRMHMKMLLHSLLWGVGIQTALFMLMVVFLGDVRGILHAVVTAIINIVGNVPVISNILMFIFPKLMEVSLEASINAEYQFLWLKRMYLISLPALLVVTFGAIEYFRRRGEEQARPEYIRGAILKTPIEINREIKKTRKVTDFAINDVKIRIEDENQHCFIIGRPRQGKTQLLNPIISKAKQRPGAKGVIFDFKGEFWGQFGTPEKGDMLFNPFDTRTLGWTIFNDCMLISDFDLLANALIASPPPNVDSIWVEGCRDIFTSILKFCYLTEKRTNRDVWKCIASSGAELKKMFESTPGCERGLKHLENPESRQVAGFLSELMVFGKCFQYLPDGPFSVTDWLYNGEGWLFVASYADVRDTLRPATGLLIELLIAKHMSMPENVSRRVFYFLDEMSALGKLSSIEMALNQGAGKGASLWILIQSFAQLDVVYGRETRDAIVNGCGLSVAFSVADPNTAKLLSEKVGDVEYWEKEVAMSYGVSNGRDGENFRRTKKCEKLFLPVEFMQLKKFECIVSLPDFGITRTKIPFCKIPMKQAAFLIKPEFNLEVIAAEYRELMNKTAEYREKTPQELLLEQENFEPQSSGEESDNRALELDIDQY